MSGGEQQMVAIGRALMSAPEILLLDEPSLGLSPLLAHELFDALARIRETGVGVLLVEQNAGQSLRIADRGYLIETGRIVGDGERRPTSPPTRPCARPISASPATRRSCRPTRSRSRRWPAARGGRRAATSAPRRKPRSIANSKLSASTR